MMAFSPIHSGAGLRPGPRAALFDSPKLNISIKRPLVNKSCHDLRCGSVPASHRLSACFLKSRFL